MSDPAVRRGLPPNASAGVSTTSDRRFRRSNSRPAKRRSWKTALRRWALIGAGCLAAIAFAAWSVFAVTNATFFRIDRVVVQGNHRLAAGEVRALLDGINSQSIFHADLEEYRTRLLDSPWVADAVLWRVFPSTVEVRVTERSPLAVARFNRQSYLVDGSGIIIDSAGPQYREYDLPIVDGLLSDENGAIADPSRIQLVERLLTELAGRDDLLKRVSQVDVSDPRNAVILLDGEPARLYLGDKEFLTRLQRYEEAVTAVREHIRAIDYYDLRFERPFVGSTAGESAAKGKKGE